MEELWQLLLSAQKEPTGIPKEWRVKPVTKKREQEQVRERNGQENDGEQRNGNEAAREISVLGIRGDESVPDLLIRLAQVNEPSDRIMASSFSNFIRNTDVVERVESAVVCVPAGARPR